MSRVTSAGATADTADVRTIVRDIVRPLERSRSHLAEGGLAIVSLCCAPVIGVLSRRLGFGLVASILFAVCGSVGLLFAVLIRGEAKEHRALDQARQAFAQHFAAGTPRREEGVRALRELWVDMGASRVLLADLGERPVPAASASPEEQLLAGLETAIGQSAAGPDPGTVGVGPSTAPLPSDRDKVIPLEPFFERDERGGRAGGKGRGGNER